MKILSIFGVLAICALGTAGASHAQQTTGGRPDVSKLTCNQAKSLIKRNGDIVVQTGSGTFERLVRNRSFCPIGEVALKFRSSTVDSRSCFVGRVCRFPELYDGGL